MAAGDPGELWVRGPNVMRGYYRESRADRADRSTPTAGSTPATSRGSDADGALFIVGRTKELIIRSGFNVYPAEVEAVLNAHPAVTPVGGRRPRRSPATRRSSPSSSWPPAARRRRDELAAVCGAASRTLQAARGNRHTAGAAGVRHRQDPEAPVADAGAVARGSPTRTLRSDKNRLKSRRST